MEYELGKSLENILTNQDTMLKALQYIIETLEDNNIKPKEKKEKQENGPKAI